LVVNNAGFGTGGPFLAGDADRYAAEIELNCAALTRLSHAAITAMVPRGLGWVLNVASLAGFQAIPDLAVYAATKAYVIHFTEALHAELAGTGVVATALCPGLTRTEFQQVSGTEGFADSYPSIAWTTPTEVARAGLEAAANGRASVVPGAVSKGLASVSSVTPRWLTRRIATFAQRR
jgi:short-subunit dehydrogenase